jgi:hypothetical protein
LEQEQEIITVCFFGHPSTEGAKIGDKVKDYSVPILGKQKAPVILHV